jgi:hypothetical protein
VFARDEDHREGPMEMKPWAGGLAFFIECESVDLRGFNVADAPAADRKRILPQRAAERASLK